MLIMMDGFNCMHKYRLRGLFWTLCFCFRKVQENLDFRLNSTILTHSYMYVPTRIFLNMCNA